MHVLVGRDVTAPASGRVSVHRLDDVQWSGIVAVWPDGYVGLIADSADEVALGDWLAAVGAGAELTQARG